MRIGVEGRGSRVEDASGFRLSAQMRFDLAHHIDLPRHINEWIVRGLIPITRRIRGGTLDVRIIVRRTRAEVQNFHAKLRAQVSELKRLGQIVFHRVGCIHAEAIAVRQAM